MADEDTDGIEDIFVKELERLLAAKEEEEALPPEEPESMADAFAIGTTEPAPAPPGPPAADPLLAPPGPPAPPMDATPPGPPAAPHGAGCRPPPRR